MLKKLDLTPGTLVFLGALLLFFSAFLFYPLWYAFVKSVVVDGQFTLTFFKLLVTNPVQREAILNSFRLGMITTLATTVLALPLAFLMVRYDFRGKSIQNGLNHSG